MKGQKWQEVERVCAFAEADKTVAGFRHSALIRLMSDCLLRISEAVAVNVEDVGNVLTIQHSETGPRAGAFPDATLYIGAPTQQAIQQYREAG